MKYIFLTQQFYDDYAHCTEIEQKQERPYVQVYIKVNGIDFAIPFRSHIKHKYAFWTDKVSRCGLDFTKTVVIENQKYIDANKNPYIRPDEHKALLGNERAIEQGLLKFLQTYRNARLTPNNHAKGLLLRYSSLQYFEKYIIS
ncbi:MAG: hypothetical protein FWG31_09695 [Oscillospiraceae bacterium]|nr:hypothetical protein [Oscillospiraceae bacterium]